MVATLAMPPVAADDLDLPALIARTPCLYEYRAWLLTNPRKGEFQPPSEFTTQECDAAKALQKSIDVSSLMDASAAGARAETAVRKADEESARRQEAALALVMSYDERMARERAEQQRLIDLQRADRERAARAREAEQAIIAARPSPALGMTRDAAAMTNWGIPAAVQSKVTSAGVFEDWLFGGQRVLRFKSGRLVAIETLTSINP